MVAAAPGGVGLARVGQGGRADRDDSVELRVRASRSGGDRTGRAGPTSAGAGPSGTGAAGMVLASMSMPATLVSVGLAASTVGVAVPATPSRSASSVARTRERRTGRTHRGDLHGIGWAGAGWESGGSRLWNTRCQGATSGSGDLGRERPLGMIVLGQDQGEPAVKGSRDDAATPGEAILRAGPGQVPASGRRRYRDPGRAVRGVGPLVAGLAVVDRPRSDGPACPVPGPPPRLLDVRRLSTSNWRTARRWISTAGLRVRDPGRPRCLGRRVRAVTSRWSVTSVRSGRHR